MQSVAYASNVGLMDTDAYATRERVAGEVRAAMARHRVTQAALAKRIGISRTVLSERLNAQRPFDVDQLMAISAVLGVNLLTFFPEQRPAVAS